MDYTIDMVDNGAPDPSEPTIERMVPVPGFGQLFLMSDDTAVYEPNNSIERYNVSEKNLRKLQRWIRISVGWWFLSGGDEEEEEDTFWWNRVRDRFFATWPAFNLAEVVQAIVDENTEVGGQL